LSIQWLDRLADAGDSWHGLCKRRAEGASQSEPRACGSTLEPTEIVDVTDENAVAAIYDNHEKAETAVKELQKGGFDMKRLSIVGRGYHSEEQVIGYYNAGDRMKHWGKLGAFWGGLWGLLFGSAFFLIPGIGPVLVGGPLVASIVGALEGVTVVGGLSALGAGLVSLGIPKDSVVRYEAALKADKFLVIAHGTADDVAKARGILEAAGAVEAETHTV
jgi:hypothetical protein